MYLAILFFLQCVYVILKTVKRDSFPQVLKPEQINITDRKMR